MIEARFAKTCDCGEQILEGDDIGKVDGEWVCADCVDDNGGEDEWKPSRPSEPDATDFLMGGAPAADEADATDFLMAEDPAPYVNASGQPKPEYEMWGQQNRGYLVTDPGTGEYRLYPQYKKPRKKGWTRVTTFVKAASESIALEKWGKRNVLIGASQSPKIVDEAYGKTHADARELDSLVARLEEIAGAKNAADHGTVVHELTERWDAGQIPDLGEVDERYRGTLELYVRTLDENGLRPVPGLIERTTCVTDFGGVAGTFDNVYLHEPSGRYLIGDKKTGKTMEYARNEYEAQLSVYARGFNRHGVFDWNTKTWQPPEVRVSEDWGVVIHLPLQGKWAGSCRALRADLKEGWEHAELCYRAIARRERLKDMPLFDGTEFDVPAEDWDRLFSSVGSSEDASWLWRQAKNAGVERMELQRLVGIAQRTLAALGS